MREYTKQEYIKIQELIEACKVEYFFSFEGLLCKGLRNDAIEKYAEENPNKKFRTWLIDRGYSVELK